MDSKIKNVIVYHASNTSDDKAPDGSSWIDFWMKNTNLPCPEICPCCQKKPTGNNYFVGAHVKLFMDLMLYRNSGTFIIPACDRCNKTYKGAWSIGHLFLIPTSHLLRIH